MSFSPNFKFLAQIQVRFPIFQGWGCACACVCALGELQEVKLIFLTLCKGWAYFSTPPPYFSSLTPNFSFKMFLGSIQSLLKKTITVIAQTVSKIIRCQKAVNTKFQPKNSSLWLFSLYKLSVLFIRLHMSHQPSILDNF